MRRHSRGKGITALIGALAVLTIGTPAAAATLLDGFAEQQVASGIIDPTAMSIAPDGRVFVSRQNGHLRVIKNDVLLPTPALMLTVDSTNERGLLGTAFDPDFTSGSPYIYIYYTRPNPGARNVVSRFTVVGDTVDKASEVVIYQLPLLGPAPIHNSGSMHFGPDGKLYISVGENSFGPHSQNLDNTFGKLLRINKDGSIPTDNPFYRGPDNPNGAIWAYGLRNPFTFAINPAGRIFVNDVGDKFWDEINDIKKGGNYGWPDTEGPHDNPAFEQSFIYLPWVPGELCTVIGAAFYNPAVRNFPMEYVGRYFYGDLCNGYIKVVDPSTGATDSFVTNITSGNTIVDIDVAPNGMLYYLRRGTNTVPGQVYKVFVSGGQPVISDPPDDQLVSVGEPATFACEASGFEPMDWTFTRTKDGATTTEASGTGHHASLSFTTTMDDDGAVYGCTFTNERGTASASATLRVTTDRTPDAWIITPAPGTLYQAGTVLSFSGDAFDTEDGPMPASAFSWSIVFDHGDHYHPAMPPTSGKSGSYSIPATGEQAVNVGYRVILTVTDSAGLKRVVERVVPPQTTTLSVFSDPNGRTIKLDGVPRTAAFSLAGVVGMQRQLDISSTQAEGILQQEAEGSATWWEFASWSNGGAAAHTIALQPGGNELTASFDRVDNPNCISPVALNRFINMPMASVQTGAYDIEFDVTPLANSIQVTLGVADGVHGGLPYQTDTLAFGRNGRVGPIAYFANQTYRARMRVDFVNRLQSAYVAPPGGGEFVVRNPTAFRAERQVDTSNDTWGAFVDRNPGTTARICNVELNCRNAKNTAPVISNLTASATSIWPPNHKMIEIKLDYAVSDNCLSTTGTPFVTVTSDEADSGVAEEDEPGDIEIVNNKTVRVRAERADEGDGRTYTITVIAVDAGGLAGSAQVTVTVPHNQ